VSARSVVPLDGGRELVEVVVLVDRGRGGFLIAVGDVSRHELRLVRMMRMRRVVDVAPGGGGGGDDGRRRPVVRRQTVLEIIGAVEEEMLVAVVAVEALAFIGVLGSD